VSRRTSTLGALLALAVMGNVVALNFCYDVPVKLFSSQLWLTAAFIAGPDLLGLWRFLVLRRPTTLAEPVPLLPRLRSRRLRWAGPAIAALFAGALVYQQLHGALEFQEKMQKEAAEFPLRGAWRVEAFTAPSTPATPKSLLAGPAWARVASGFGRMGIARADGSFARARVEVAPDGTVKLTQRDVPEPDVVRLVRTDAEHVRLVAEGFEVSLAWMPESAFMLRGRGFNWVQPMPINR
jgi:hypothetical protein